MKTKQIFLTNLLLFFLILPFNYAQDMTNAGLPENAIARLGKGGINVMRFSPDGSHFAVGTDVGLWLYDVATSEEYPMFTGQKGQVNVIAFSPDGKTIASSGFSNPIIQIWNVQNKRKILHFNFIENNKENPYNALVIKSIEYSKDGKTLISLDGYGKIVHWDIEKRTKTKMKNSLQIGKSIAYSNEYNGFASGYEMGNINLWDATTGKIRIKLRAHAGLIRKEDKEIWALAFSPDGKILASGSEDKTVRLWNTENGKNIVNLGNHGSRIVAVAFSFDGKTLAVADGQRNIRLWHVQTHREIATLLGHTDGICSLTFSPDNTTLASGSHDGTIRFWNQDTGAIIKTFATGWTEAISALEFSNDSNFLTSASLNGTVDVWSVNTQREINTFTPKNKNKLEAVTFSKDATLMATQRSNWDIVPDPLGLGFNGGGEIEKFELDIRDITSDTKIKGPWDKGLPINALCFSNDNKILVTGIEWEGIVFWDINTGEELFRVNDDSPFPRNFLYSPDGNLFASFGTFVETHIINMKPQEKVTPRNMTNAAALAFSPDNTLIATAFHEGIILWDITPTGIKQRGRINNTRISDVMQFSPDSQILLNTKLHGWDYVINLWDVKTGWNLATFSGHTEKITSLKFSKDGKTLATGSLDGTILLWDWDQIVRKARNDMKGKNLKINISPSEEPIQYANKAEEADAVIKYLEEKEYKFEKTKTGFTLKRDGSSANVSGGGTVGIGEVKFQINRNGEINISIRSVGEATFNLDENNNLIFMERNSDKNVLD